MISGLLLVVLDSLTSLVSVSLSSLYSDVTESEIIVGKDGLWKKRTRTADICLMNPLHSSENIAQQFQVDYLYFPRLSSLSRSSKTLTPMLVERQIMEPT